MSARTPAIAWTALLAIGGALAAVAVVQWAGALLSGRAVLYGEGAVAHAALLFREGDAYRDASGLVAANYPPPFLALASLGDPFRAGRAVTIASALAVAALVWWRAAGAGPIARAALAALWLALVPVAIWGAAVKPDLLAVALTVAGVLALERVAASGSDLRAAPRGVVIAAGGGALLAAAVWTKPTALLPALTVVAYLGLVARPALTRAAAGAGLVATVALANAVLLGFGDLWRHVVVWNALPWSAEQALLLAVLGAATLGIVVAAAALGGALRGIALAYVAGGLGVVLLGGREGATINYLLDLAAATSVAAAIAAPRLARSAAFPSAAVAQVALAVILVAPFDLVPGRDAATGSWGDPRRAQVIEELARDRAHLVEDSGLLVAAGMRPVVDDLFLWSRLARAGLIDPGPLIERVRRGEIATVVSEADLERLDAAPAYERARWHPDLAAAVLERYELAEAWRGSRGSGAVGAPTLLWIYRPR